MVDYTKSPDHYEIKDNFGIGQDIIKDLYKLDISKYKLKAKVLNY